MSPCIHCDRGEVLELPGYGSFRRITSDCRPWDAGGRLGICTFCATVQKPVTPAWLEECRRIYARYHAYHQGQGAEQAVFLPGGAGQARSKAFLSWVFGRVPAAAAGRLLDVGCGNGNLLASMSELFPGWRLAGADLGDGHRAEVEAIAHVEGFHNRGLEDLPGGFDLVTAVHLLEHLDQPVRSLGALAACLVPGGRLALEVPNLRSNPFDLLIADHASHFTPASLRRDLAAGGLRGAVHEDVIPRELSALVQRQESADAPKEGRPDLAGADADSLAATRTLVDHHLAWLLELRTLARQRADREGSVALLGSSIAAGWLAGELDGRASCFVDEDPARTGGSFLGRPILTPSELPKQASLLLPLPPATAGAVAPRMAALGLDVVLPPPW